MAAFDLDLVRAEFPALAQDVNGQPLRYLDNAATTQRPQAVLQAWNEMVTGPSANINRGAHALARAAQARYDAARESVARFIGAPRADQIVWTKGCTEALNLVAQSWGRANLKPNDVILVGTNEHHANLVPWQMVAAATGAVVRPIPITDAGELDLAALSERLDERVRVVAIKHICNVLGTVNPVTEITRMAHAVGAIVVVDGAQALAHIPVDVAALDVDFYCGGSHKVYGPMGVGFLYGRRELLEAMPPYQGGGDMIRTVAFDHVTFAEVPHKFEAGTPNVAGVVAFGAALEWFAGLDREAAWAHEDELARMAAAEIAEIPGAQLRGTASGKAPVVSFTVDWAHPHDLGTVLDQHGVAVRTGHHCCMPLMTHFGIPGTVRASFAVYNTKQDKEVLIRALHRAREIFA